MVTYQVISFVLFLAVSAGVTVWVFRMNRQHLERMARLPLDDQSSTHDPLNEVHS